MAIGLVGCRTGPKGLPGFLPTQKSQESSVFVKAIFLQEKKGKEALCPCGLTWHGLGLGQRAESQAPPSPSRKGPAFNTFCCCQHVKALP